MWYTEWAKAIEESTNDRVRKAAARGESYFRRWRIRQTAWFSILALVALAWSVSLIWQRDLWEPLVTRLHGYFATKPYTPKDYVTDIGMIPMLAFMWSAFSVLAWVKVLRNEPVTANGQVVTPPPDNMVQ